MKVICPRCSRAGRALEEDPSRYCRDCRNESSKRTSAKIKKERPFRVYANAKNTWNRKNGYPTDMTEDYLKGIWTGTCEITGVEITINGARDDPHRANLDRKNPNLGYNIGNVTWLSARANRIKNNATLKELKDIVKWLEQ
jgi:hypothetical protein